MPSFRGKLRQLLATAEAAGISAEAPEQLHQVALGIEELLLRARQRLQARPDTS